MPHPHAGKSIIEILWEHLDDVMDKLMEEGKPESWESGSREVGVVGHWQQYGEERGQAQGLAYALAVMTNPYHPDMDGIRANAVKRWEERAAE